MLGKIELCVSIFRFLPSNVESLNYLLTSLQSGFFMPGKEVRVPVVSLSDRLEQVHQSVAYHFRKVSKQIRLSINQEMLPEPLGPNVNSHGSD